MQEQEITGVWQNFVRPLMGALLSEIEPHVDQSLIRDDGGHVVGRRLGIRSWLRENCPLLAAHYKTAMGYKALADKAQAAIGLPSKYSIVDVIDVLIEFGGKDGVGEAAETAGAAADGTAAVAADGTDARQTAGCRMKRRDAVNLSPGLAR